MKLHKFLLSTLAASVVALTGSTASADIVLIDLNTSGDFEGGDVTGDLIDAAEATITFPASFLVPEAQGTTTPDAAGLTLIINGFTTNDPNGGQINASGNNFGVNSDGGGDSATRLDEDFDESITISFNRDLFLTNISFNGLSGTGEQFLVNDILIGQDGDVGTDFNFSGSSATGTDLTGGLGGSEGIFFAAGDTITFAPSGAGAEVGVRDIRVHVPPAVPEPGSLALLGLLGGVAAIRRRR